MSEQDRQPAAFQEEMYKRIADILHVLSGVAAGDFGNQLLIDTLESEPVAALYRGINETIVALADERSRREAYQNELEEKLFTIARQELAIRELSTPVIEIWNGVLCLPIVGILDPTRSADITEALLRAVTERQTRYAIIDITGIET